MAMLPSGEWVEDGTSGTSGVSNNFNDAAIVSLLEGMAASTEGSNSTSGNQSNPAETPEPSAPSDDFASASQIIKEVKEGIDKYLAITTLGIIPSDEELVEIYVNIQMGIAQAEANAAAAKLKEEEAKVVSEAYKVEREAKIQAAVKAQLEEAEALKAYEETVLKMQKMTPEERQRQAAEALKASASNFGSTGINGLLNSTPVTNIETEVANSKADLEVKKQAAKTLTETLHKLKPPRASNPDVVKIQGTEWKEFQEKISLKKEKIQKTNEELNKVLEITEKLKKDAMTEALRSGGMGLTDSISNKKTPAQIATEKRWMNSLNDVEIAKYDFTRAKQEWYDLRPPGEIALEIDLTANEQKEIVEEQKKLAISNITKGPGSFEFKNKIATLKATVSEINDTVKDMAKELATSIADSLMPTMIAPGAPNPLSSALRLLINTMRIKRSIDTILRLTSKLLGIALELGIADHPAIEKIANLVKPMLELKAKTEEETEKASSNADKPVDKSTYKAKSPASGSDITGPQIEVAARNEKFKDKNVEIYNWPLTEEGLKRLEKMKKKDKGDNKFAQWADTFKAYNEWLAALNGVN